jgi:hypothetical protein
MKRKSDERERTVFRTDRFFTSDGKWFFTTREGGNIGPFETQAVAQQALIEYLIEMGFDPGQKDSWDTPGATN